MQRRRFQGYDTTVPVTLEDMIHHTKAVRRCDRTLRAY
jgi:ketopantoate hydroxymethyltransferase